MKLKLNSKITDSFLRNFEAVGLEIPATVLCTRID